jgi:nucleoside 2-deoxyribosyltransferase
MRAYVSVSYEMYKNLQAELKVIEAVLSEFNMESFVFVNRYQFGVGEEIQMMAQAMRDIDQSSILIAETSDKAIGIGIEAGYAKAKNKPVIYLRNAKADHSTTLAGISDYRIIYKDLSDLTKLLRVTLSSCKSEYLK